MQKKFLYCRLVCYSLVWADNLKCLTCTAIPAIPPALEDPTDQNSDAARELQSLGRGMVATVTACCRGNTFLGDNTVGRSILLWNREVRFFLSL